jgi:integrase
MTKQRTGENLHEITPGRWKVTVNIPASANPDHKRHRRVAYVTGGKRIAQAKRRELLTARDQGKLKPRTAGTVAEYLDKWLRGRRSTVAARTATRWSVIIRCQVNPHIGAMLLRDVRPATLREFYAALQASGLSGTTCEKVHATLRQAFAQAVTDDELAVNPALMVKAPHIDTGEAKAMNEDEAKRLLTALADSPLYVPVLVTLDCGLRRGEVLALKWDGVNIKERTIVVRGAIEESGKVVTIRQPKTGHARVVRLTERAALALDAHRRRQAELRLAMANRWHDEGLVFAATDDHVGKLAGRIWRPTSFSRLFRAETRAAGFTIGLHTLRHTMATTMLRAGVDSRVVADRMGHSKTGMTQDTYQHVLPDQQREAVAAYERRMGG